MKHTRILMANLMIAVLLVVWCSTAIRSQNAASSQSSTANLNAMSSEEKLVRDVYARLMRYQSAAVDERVANTGEPAAPTDFLTFELRNIHSGPVSEIENRQMSEIVTERVGDVINVNAVRLRGFDGPSYAYYEASWTSASASKETAQHPEESRRFAAFNRYTSYQVLVRLNGKQRNYRAVALYNLVDWDSTSKSRSLPANVQILDNITVDMNVVYRDESPRIHAPWKKYSKTKLFRAITKSIKEKITAGTPLRPEDAPIGYLPGDDAEIAFAISSELAPIDGGGGDDGGGDGGGSGGLPPACVGVTFSPITAVGKNFTRTVTVTISPAVPVTLTLSTTTGTGSAVFTSNNSSTLNVSQSTDVEIKGVTESSTKDNIRLQATQNGSSAGFKDFTVIMVTISMRITDPISTDNAGRTAYSTLLGTEDLKSFKSSGTNQNHIWRNGVEFKAVITPSNFASPVTLNRIVDKVKSYNNQTLTSEVGPFGDTSDGVLRDDDPQSGNSGGKVYDLDAPGLGSSATAAVGIILRTRINFHAWATVDGGARVSTDFQWFSKQSVTKTATGDQLINDVSNDNKIGPGTTNLTWNLQ